MEESWMWCVFQRDSDDRNWQYIYGTVRTWDNDWELLEWNGEETRTDSSAKIPKCNEKRKHECGVGWWSVRECKRDNEQHKDWMSCY